MIVVAASVIVASLLIQGTCLLWLLRRLDLRAEDFGPPIDEECDDTRQMDQYCSAEKGEQGNEHANDHESE